MQMTKRKRYSAEFKAKVAGFCVEALKEELARYGPPEIFNSEQGSQFDSTEFTNVLRGAKVKISPLGTLLRNALPGSGWTVAGDGLTTE